MISLKKLEKKEKDTDLHRHGQLSVYCKERSKNIWRLLGLTCSKTMTA